MNYELLEQLEMVKINTLNVKTICKHPFVDIVLMQIEDAIQMVKKGTE